MTSLDAFIDDGGGQGLTAALRRSPEEVIEEVRRSGLRGRGGAGFPTGIKWRTVRDDPCPTRFVACNAAEGEPGTFKDRWLLRMNPYQVLEGLGIAAHAVGAERIFIGIKSGFEREIVCLRRAMEEMDVRSSTSIRMPVTSSTTSDTGASFRTGPTPRKPGEAPDPRTRVASRDKKTGSAE